MKDKPGDELIHARDHMLTWYRVRFVDAVPYPDMCRIGRVTRAGMVDSRESFPFLNSSANALIPLRRMATLERGGRLP